MNWPVIALIFLIGAPGSIAISWLALPQLVEAESLPVSLQILQLVSTVQSLILVAIAATIGSALSPRVGLGAPLLTSIVNRHQPLPTLRRQTIPGIVGGIAGAAILVGFYTWAPPQLAAIQETAAIPLVARILYGGVTEEILIRWGLMTLIAWLGYYRLVSPPDRPASSMIMGVAITVSAVAFGLSHLPAASAPIATMTTPLAIYITAGNAAFGIIAGYLFWRYGLESASWPTA